MEYSLAWGRRAAVAALDAVARLALPASILALLHGKAEPAIAASLVVTAASLARAFLVGGNLELELTALWRRVVAAARKRSLSSMQARRDEEESLSLMIYAVFDTASFRANALPLLVSRAACLVVLAVAALVVLGPGWVVVGAIAGSVVGGVVLAGHRRLRRSQERTWSGFSHLASDMRVLLEATAELRANGREEAVAERALAGASTMARGHRETATYSAMLSLLPAGLAVLGLAAPLSGGARWLGNLFDTARMADVLLLGGAAAATAFALASSFESVSTTAPSRRAVRELLEEGRTAPALVGGSAKLGGSLAEVPLAFDDVSVVYPGNDQRTPGHVTFEWAARSGVAVVGPNGSGKSTLALCLLGFIAPTEGAIRVGGSALFDLDLTAYRSRIAYAPQAPFVAPGESVAWHMRLLLGPEAEEAAMRRGLERVGLLGTLEHHAGKRGAGPLDVPLAELSGGERRRLFVARLLLQRAELFVLDEPEAGMDGEGRATLRAVLEELSQTARVLVVAHDRAVIPPGFAVLACACDASSVI